MLIVSFILFIIVLIFYVFFFFFFMIRRPPRSTRTDTLFPSTTLFRSPVRQCATADHAWHTLADRPVAGGPHPGQCLHAALHCARRRRFDQPRSPDRSSGQGRHRSCRGGPPRNAAAAPPSSEERRGGKEWGGTGKSRGRPLT